MNSIPNEPTKEMIEAGFKVLENSGIADGYSRVDKLLVAEIYRAMSCLNPLLRLHLSRPEEKDTKKTCFPNGK
jgi:hypothetical protein